MLVSAASSVARFNILAQSWDLGWEAWRREGSEVKRLIDWEVERIEGSETEDLFSLYTLSLFQNFFWQPWLQKKKRGRWSMDLLSLSWRRSRSQSIVERRGEKLSLFIWFFFKSSQTSNRDDVACCAPPLRFVTASASKELLLGTRRPPFFINHYSDLTLKCGVMWHDMMFTYLSWFNSKK